METVKAPDSRGPRGEGRLEVINDTQVGVTITDNEGKTTYFTLTYPQGISLVRIGKWPLQAVDDVFIQLTPDKEDIQYVRPRNGTFFVEFSRFGAEDGELPSIRWEPARDYKGEPWLPERFKSFPLYEIFAGGVYSGMEILDTLTHQFMYDENLNVWRIVESTRQKYREHFDAFLNVFGFDRQHDDFPYEGNTYSVQRPDEDGGDISIPNPLAHLEAILQRAKKVAQVTVENGWVVSDSIQQGPFGMSRRTLERAIAEDQVEEIE